MVPEGDPRAQRSSEESLAGRLKARFGEEVDPKVSLPEGEDERGRRVDFSSAVVARLSGRSGSFGRYEVKDEIARGGMGAILRVWDEDLRRHLAMKVTLGTSEAHASQTGADELALIESRKLARFLEEAQVTGQLDHPGIVPVHELGLDPKGGVYFTMKLVKGRSLKDVFDLVAAKKEGWTETKALGVLLKVCEAMSYAHHKGVIHRDLKPANVMVGKFGEVHVMDWGLARILGRKDERDIRVRDDAPMLTSMVRSDRVEHRSETPDSPLYTMAGDVVGTPAYMPPEQAGGRVDEMGPHSDVYALGAMLYHLFAGHMPYVPPGARLTNYAIWGLVQQGPPTPIATLAPRMPIELVAICEKAMGRDWKERYRDMSELSADLSAYLEHRVVSAYETGAWAETKKWVERNKPLATSLAAGVIALIAGLAASISLERKAERNAQLAEERRIEADRSATEAEAKHQEVLRLSSLAAIEDLTDLERDADHLWPVEPSRLSAYDSWLERAHHLVEGRAADPVKGVDRVFELADYRAELSEVRSRALPRTEDDRAADRRSSPQYAAWQAADAERSWIARMLGDEDWPMDLVALPDLPADAKELNRLAWEKIDPTSPEPTYGEEQRALEIARRAVAAAREEDQPEYRDTLAWALYSNGRFDEALAEERQAAIQAVGHLAKVIEASSRRLSKDVESWSNEQGRQLHIERRAQLEARMTHLEKDVDLRRTYRFEKGRDRWRHGQLSALVDGLEAFRDPSTGLFSAGISPDHSWGVVRRRDLAAALEEKTVTGSDVRARWTEAIAAIESSPKYGGLRLVPQTGLVPLGPDPESGLWEFSHVASAERFDATRRGIDGRLFIEKETGIVLVLIPGGTFRMGAQSTDPTSGNFDPQADEDESPVHEMTLSPYFLSKFEMTQAQWLRLAARNPSLYEPANYRDNWDAKGAVDVLLHPAERVSWAECMDMLPRFGLTLPTEAEWEFACRAGTTSAYWSGEEVESLRGVANVSDSYGKSHGNEAWERWEAALDDGQTVHAPVGRYRPSPFGLHDMHGNVWEWCRDGYGEYTLPVRERDGERRVANPAKRVFRGGSFAGLARFSRSAKRHSDSPDRRGSGIGFRPAANIRGH